MRSSPCPARSTACARARRDGEGARSRRKETGPLCVAAIDPANPWGALVPWPETVAKGARARRIAGAWVILMDGEPWIWSKPNGRGILTFQVSGSSPERWTQAFEALAAAPRTGKRRSVVIETIDEVASADSPHVQALEAAGWVRDYGGHMAPLRSARRAAGDADA